MSITTAFAIYFVLWWIVLFAVLPWGIKTQDEAGEITPGTEKSAPSDPQLKRKFIITSCVSAVILACFEVAVRAGITLDGIPFLPQF